MLTPISQLLRRSNPLWRSLLSKLQLRTVTKPQSRLKTLLISKKKSMRMELFRKRMRTKERKKLLNRSLRTLKRWMKGFRMSQNSLLRTNSWRR